VRGSLRVRFLLPVVVWLAALVPVRADDCRLRLVASLALAIGPNTNGIFAPVNLNGAQKFLLVDTGGIVSTLTPEVADLLSLPTHDSTVELVNLAGQRLNKVAIVDRFAFGNLPPLKVEFLLEPPDDRVGGFGGEIAGTLAPDILRNFDVEIDFTAAKLNLFLPRTCGDAVYWKADNIAAVKMDVLEDGHIVFPMRLDGRQVMTALDTGMSVTSLDLPTARDAFGLDVAAGDVERVGRLNDTDAGVLYSHRFQTLTTEGGGVSVVHPRIFLLPDLIGEPDKRGIEPSQPSSSRAKLLLGLSVLQRLHLYIAYQQRMLYFTPASGRPR
jgi:predicted aspartyl protease